MFSLVEELVLAEWKTLRNTHVNRPRELLRSIIIDALAAAVSEDHNSSGVVWNSAASPLRHRQTHPGKAASLIEKLLKGAGQLAEQEAVDRAGLVATKPIKRRQKKASAAQASLQITASICDDDVLADVARSAGPKHPQKQNLDDPNPHAPNAGTPWADEFTTRMATALSNAVNLGNARIAEALSDQLAAYLDAKLLQSDMSQTHESNRMRLDVLWWSEALYSPVLQVGYRELDLNVAAVAAAVDLSNIVPALAPASVLYVLGEALLRISELKDSNGEEPVLGYLEGIADKKVEFGDRLPAGPTDNRRQPLVDLVGEAATGSRISHDSIRQRTGVDPLLVLSPGEFSMWVFRGIQARRLVEALR